MRVADRVRGALSRDSFARSVGVGVAGAAGAQALSVMFVPVITRLYDPHAFGVLAVYVGIVPIGFLLGGANQVLTAWAVAQGRLTRVAQTRVVQSLGQVVIQLACGVVRGGPAGLILGDAGGRGCAALVLLTGWWR